MWGLRGRSGLVAGAYTAHVTRDARSWHPYCVAVGLVAAFVLLGGIPAAALDPDRAVTQYQVQVWNAQQGLPHNSISWLAQDEAGYLVIGTFRGNVRFDGIRFEPLPGELAGARFSGYTRAPDGAEWFCGDRLLRRGDDGVAANPTTEAIGQVTDCYFDHDGALLIGGSLGLGRLDATGELSILPGPDGGSIRVLLRDSRGILHAGTDGGLFVQAGAANWRPARGVDRIAVLYCIEDRQGRIWVGTDSGVTVLGVDGEAATPAEAEGLPIRSTAFSRMSMETSGSVPREAVSSGCRTARFSPSLRPKAWRATTCSR